MMMDLSDWSHFTRGHTTKKRLLLLPHRRDSHTFSQRWESFWFGVGGYYFSVSVSWTSLPISL